MGEVAASWISENMACYMLGPLANVKDPLRGCFLREKPIQDWLLSPKIMFKEINQFSAHTPHPKNPTPPGFSVITIIWPQRSPLPSAEAQRHHATNLPQSQLANDHRNLVFEVLRRKKKTRPKGEWKSMMGFFLHGPFFNNGGMVIFVRSSRKSHEKNSWNRT